MGVIKMKLLTNILLGYCGVLTIGTALVIDLIQIELFLCVIVLLLGAIVMVMVTDRQCAETAEALCKNAAKSHQRFIRDNSFR